MEYTDDLLKERRRKYLELCKPDTLRNLKREGTLDDHLENSARRCRERAESLMAGGTFSGQAWQWAIREVLLETEAD